MQPGIYFDISNEDYHAGDGVSKSQLDFLAKSPALLQWVKDAPEDEEKKSALDMGTALHCLLLEPDEFDKRFIIAPEFNRRTSQGKADEEAFLKSVADRGATVMTAEEGRKLRLMRESAMAHPVGRFLLEATGHCEVSMYWNDEATGELCRIRPDKWLPDHRIIVDVKKVGDMDRFARHVDEFRYHLQEAMYREGALRTTGEQHSFVFLAVSESIDCGRYPVRVFELDPPDAAAGSALFRRDLNTYHRCRQSDEWNGIETLKRPDWARKQDKELMSSENQNTQSRVLEDFEVISTPLDLPVTDLLDRVPLLTPEQLAEVYSQVERIESFCKAVRERVASDLIAGLPVPGFKLVSAPQGAPEWSDEAAAEELLKSFRLKQDQMYSQTVITPALAEKLLKEDSPRRWPKVEALITCPDGKPIIAPESDPRPALNITPENDFADVSDETFADDLI
jgi:exodeoxyribonuclease VIII